MCFLRAHWSRPDTMATIKHMFQFQFASVVCAPTLMLVRGVGAMYDPIAWYTVELHKVAVAFRTKLKHNRDIVMDYGDINDCSDARQCP